VWPSQGGGRWCVDPLASRSPAVQPVDETHRSERNGVTKGKDVPHASHQGIPKPTRSTAIHIAIRTRSRRCCSVHSSQMSSTRRPAMVDRWMKRVRSWQTRSRSVGVNPGANRQLEHRSPRTQECLMSGT